jgi:homoserine O-succinyltransferase
MPVLSLNPSQGEMTVRPQGRPLVIGLVNNMPDKALASTERQFRDVLARAAGNLPVVLRIFSIAATPRSDVARQHVREYYDDVENLWGTELDGLIVTGNEPRAADLADEPYWPTLTRLVDWTADSGIPSIWSCLAAHAAVRHLDGIDRRTRPEKLSGVFDCAKAADHPLVEHSPAQWCTPHSRRNDLPEEDLRRSGYQVLARAPDAGVDLFTKRLHAVFLFTQGHPEYDREALLREYRRDVGRFLRGMVEPYPEMPCGYFDETAAAALAVFRETALRRRDAALLAEFPFEVARRNLAGPWLTAATRLYSDWLAYVAAEQSLRQAVRPHSAVRAASRVGAYG